MTEQIEFEETRITDPATKRGRDAVAVIRNGHQVAVLPEFDRLRRALSLPLKRVQEIVNEFPAIMNREATHDEEEFWKAVLEYKRSQSCE